MYHNFKTYRGYLNARLHALSIVICGDDTTLRAELARLGKSHTTEITDNEAKQLLKELEATATVVKKNIAQVKQILSPDALTDKQRRKIIWLTKYNFHWLPQSTFSFIVKMFPYLRDNLTRWELKHSNLQALFRIVSADEADEIIKRLTKIKGQNEKDKHSTADNA